MIKLPKDVEFIFNKLKENGYEAYIVGGCVRDVLLGIEPGDWDIATNATPDAIGLIFDKTIDVGKRFGTVKILLKEGAYEVTTFRRDGAYSDSRRPDRVVFSQDIKEDLKRRDFTINAMAYNQEIGLIDEFDGQKHLFHKKIMCVGDANERFQEDALRMIRGIRFASQYAFEIEKNTYEAIVINREKLKEISVERVQQEFNKILLSVSPSYGISLMAQTGIGIIIFPQCNRLGGIENKMDLKKIDGLESQLILRLVAFLYLITKSENRLAVETADSILKQLKYDRKTVTQTTSLLKGRMDISNIQTPVELKRLMRKIGRENTSLLLKLYGNDCSNRGHAIFLQKIVNEILTRDDPIDYEDLSINGTDMMQEGFRGKEIGGVIENLINIVHEEPNKNKRETLLEIMKTLRNR